MRPADDAAAAADAPPATTRDAVIEVVARRTAGVVPAAYVAALAHHGRARGAAAVAPADAARIARLLLDDVGRRAARDAEMLAGYRRLGLFLAYVALFVVVVGMQRDIGGANRAQYGAVRDTLFAFNGGVRHPTDAVGESVAGFAVVRDWLRDDVVGTIFEESTCGDGFCEPRDEQPFFDAGDGARAFPGPCEADCGRVETTKVTVSFFDVGKLEDATRMLRALGEADFRGVSAAKWGADGGSRPPVAGWNLCHTSDREFGTPETACVFDGDVSIRGLPYRTAELDVDAVDFGGTKEVLLYAGDWELRYAFANFSWVDPETGDDVPIGFPAIRGEVCVTGVDGRDVHCERWDPCPDAASCACEYVDSTYRCYDASHWGSFDAASMMAADDSLDRIIAAYPESAGLGAVADWWRVPRFSPDATAWGSVWKPKCSGYVQHGPIRTNSAEGITQTSRSRAEVITGPRTSRKDLVLSEIDEFQGWFPHRWGSRGPPDGASRSLRNAELWDADAAPFTVILLTSYYAACWYPWGLEIVRSDSGATVFQWLPTDVGCASTKILLSTAIDYEIRYLMVDVTADRLDTQEAPWFDDPPSHFSWELWRDDDDVLVARGSVEIKMFRIRSTWSNSNGFGEGDRPDLEISRRDDHRSKNEPK